MLRAILIILLVASIAFFCARRGSMPPPSLHASANLPGKSININECLEPGKECIVCFFADWCPTCKQWMPCLNVFAANRHDLRISFINIDNFDSPVATQYGIRSVPTFWVYDKRGNRIASGQTGKDWVRSHYMQLVNSSQ